MFKPYDPETPPEEGWIPPCPASGDGCHAWLYRAVNALVAGGWPDDSIDSWVNRWMGRPPQPNEISNTLRKVKVEINNPTEERFSIPKPPLNDAVIKEYGSQPDTSIEEIMSYSPIAVEGLSSSDHLRVLYGADEKTIVFTNEQSQGQLVWSHETPDALLENAVRNNKSGAWMLLNPVSGESKYVDRLGKESRRSEETLTKYKYCLIEADNTPVEKWLTILKNLSLPIKSITLSGNQSAHSIVEVNAKDKKHWQKIASDLAAIVVPLGACSGSLTAVRLTRLAQVMRPDTGKMQKLIYLNQEPRMTKLIRASSPRPPLK